MEKIIPTLFVDIDVPTMRKKSPNIPFGLYGRQWIEENQYTFAVKTYERYLDMFKRIESGIGHIPLKKITPYHINQFLNNLRQDGINKRTGGRLSEKTVLHHYRLISVILRQACREQLIKDNPATKEYIRPPKNVQHEIKILQMSEVQQLLKKLNTAPIKWKTATLLMLFTGMRRGELCGLEWHDIDFDKKTISVVRTSQYTSNKGIFTKETKTSGSYRTFTISDNLIRILHNYQDWYKENFIDKVGNKRLFVKLDGTPIHPDSVTDWLEKFSQNNLQRKITPHMLRHTYVSMLVYSGIDLKEISRRVGHSDLSTTCRIYTHCMELSDSLAASALNDYIF